MVLCTAYGCNSRSDKGVKVSFHQFHKDEKVRKQWIDRLNRGESAFQKFKPTHHKLCGKHFEEDQFERNFANKIGYEEEFRKRLKSDAIPTIFPNEHKQQERRLAAKIQDKRRKFELKAALKEQARLTPETDIIFDHGPLEAVPWVSSAVTTIPCSSTVTTSATCLSTVTTTTSNTVMSTQCPLTWFATVTEKQPRLDSSWTRSEPDTKNGELSIEMEDVESARPATCMEIQSSCSSATKKTSSLSIKGATQTEKFSMQTQTPQNLVSRRSVLIQNAAKMVDASTQTKRIMNIPRRTPAADISLNDSLISMTSDDPDRDMYYCCKYTHTLVFCFDKGIRYTCT